ncbi:hypothetical protein SAMN04488245_11339 [Alloyangia pacifica]|uniref:Uncharacterized protein n=1 Tax=Alloyangia pacifica TaxID=311180 RepID=A0A1I6VYF4_9RHOB|nr:hypothetical protein SAMN04488245_11339 [Alloyangia pacifica]SFT18736.1 hypothetical protein SAMN04488050_113184 [Alloyangia pacifica]
MGVTLRDTGKLATGATQAGPALARGVALQRPNSALYPSQTRTTFERRAQLAKRQPAGTGRRWPGAFGLIPGHSVPSSIATGSPS